MSTFTGLSTMVRGIHSNQLSLNTIGHNITNAGTDGYSRQSVNLAATSPEYRSSLFGQVALGTGVDAASLTRARDIFADIKYRSETATEHYQTTMALTYDRLEAVFNDAQEDGLQDALLDFYKSWVDLSTEASTSANRTATVETGKILSDLIQTTAAKLQDQIREEYTNIENNVDDVEEILESIVSTNRLIVATEAGGASANDLRDQRDLLADKLATYTNINVIENSAGAYQIVSGGVTLVNGMDRLHLSMSSPLSSAVYGVDYGVEDFTVKIKESNIVYSPQNGILKAQFDSIDECKKRIDDLANLANFMMTTFNAQHKQGWDLKGSHKDTTERNSTGDLLTNSDGSIVQVPDTINFFGVTGETYEYNFNFTGKYNEMVVTDVKGVTTTISGIKIINMLGTNAQFDEISGYQYVAAASSFDESTDYTDTTISDSRRIEWGNRTADGSNAVYLSNLFNLSHDTIVSTGRANAAVMKLYTLKDQYGKEIKDSDGNPVYMNALDTSSINSYYNSAMTEMGVRAATTDTRIEEQKSVMEQINDWRNSVSGVDWNEELAYMIQFQKGFSACSRCLSAMDECLDRLVNNTGMVGR